MEGVPKPVPEAENTRGESGPSLNKAKMALTAAAALAAVEGATAHEYGTQADYLDDPGYEKEYERTFDRDRVSDELRNLLPQKLGEQLDERGLKAADGTFIELQDAGISDEQLAVKVAIYEQHGGREPIQTMIVELSASSAIVEAGNIIMGSPEAAMFDLTSKLKSHKILIDQNPA